MNIAVVGAGAMGGLISTFLHEAGNDVVLIDRDAERTELVNQRGIFIEGVSGDRTVHVKSSCAPEEIGHRDLILLCVKAYDTATACQTALPLVGPSSVVLTLQNGLGNVEKMAEVFGADKVLGGTIAHGATVVSMGYIRHAGAGEAVLGAASDEGKKHLPPIVELLNKSGITTRSTDDLPSLLWSKLVINVGINPFTAILRVANGVLLENENTRDLMRRAVEEILLVARAKNIRLLHDDPIANVEAVSRATAANRSSMLQDVLAGKQTEIDYINGAVVREAEALGLEVPVNRVLTDLVLATVALADKRLEEESG